MSWPFLKLTQIKKQRLLCYNEREFSDITLEELPQLSFSIDNALNNFLNDSKVLITLLCELGLL